MYPETGVVIFGIRSPYIFNQFIISEHAATVLSQKRHDFVFVLSQMDVRFVSGDQSFFKINGQAAMVIGMEERIAACLVRMVWRRAVRILARSSELPKGFVM